MYSVGNITSAPYFTAAQQAAGQYAPEQAQVQAQAQPQAQVVEQPAQDTVELQQQQQVPEEQAPSPSIGKKIIVGLGLAAIVAAGVYFFKGRGKKAAEAIKEEVKNLSDGRTLKKSVDDKGRTVLNVYDKDGNFLFGKTKKITKTEKDGKKFISKIDKYSAADKEGLTYINGEGNFQSDAVRRTNRTYVDGHKTEETIYRKNNNAVDNTAYYQKERKAYDDKGVETNRARTYFDDKGKRTRYELYGVNPNSGHTYMVNKDF